LREPEPRGGPPERIGRDPQLEPLPLTAPFQSSQRFGQSVYWLSADQRPALLRSGFDDVEPKTVMQMVDGDDFFSVEPG